MRGNPNLMLPTKSVVTVITGLLITSERSHYFRKSYLEKWGLTSTKLYAFRRTEIRLKFLKVLTLVWVAGTNAIKDKDRVISHEMSYTTVIQLTGSVVFHYISL